MLDFGLTGKNAIVCASSKGLGLGCAQALAKTGVNLVMCARGGELLEKVAADIRSETGVTVKTVACDITSAQGREAVLAAAGHVDILVNNAGAAWTATYDEFPESGWDKVMDLNLKALFFLTQKLTPLLRKSGNPSQPAKVINIASIDGIHNARHEAYSYAASKAGLIHLTRRMAKRLVSENIHINAIAPGAFASDMNLWARDNPDEVAQRIPAQRIGKPSDIAGTAVYMCSSAGDYLVGITIAVDGGIAYAS